MEHDGTSNDVSPVLAIAMARCLFVRDVSDIQIRYGITDRPMKGTFVPADRAYYEELATLIIQRVAECPAHAAEDIADLLIETEDLACQQVRGIVRMSLTGGTPADLMTIREANNRKLGLPFGS